MEGSSRGTLSDTECLVVTERLAVSCSALVSHVQLACCSSHFAYPWQGTELRIHSNTDPGVKPLQLVGHHGNISAVVFGDGQDPLILCSASDDYIIIWDVKQCYSRAREGLIAPGTVIGTLLGKVVYLSLSPENKRAAACTANKIYILNTKKMEVLGVLEGHLGALTAAEFYSWDGDFLVSVSEDRTFRLWDVAKEQVLHQSSVLSAFPLLSVYLCKKTKQLVTGSADGQVWCFTLPNDHKCRLVSKLDLQKVVQRNRSYGEEGPVSKDGVDMVETTKPVLRIGAFTPSPDDVREEDRASYRAGNCVWIGSSDALYLINLATSELCSTLNLKGAQTVTVSAIGSWAIFHGDENRVLCVVASLFDPTVALLEVGVPGSSVSLRSFWASSGEQSLSVLPSARPMPESPLNAELPGKDACKPRRRTDSRGGVKDQALVFHSQIKSSGYGMAPRMVMFSPKTNAQKKSPGPQKTSQRNRCLFAEYPVDTAPPSILHTHLSTGGRPTAIHSLQYSGDGKQILCGLGDGSALVYKSSLTGTPAICSGHAGAVTVGWSHSRKWFLTAAEDHSLRIWPLGTGEPALIMGRDRFPKPVRSAQFFYLDKFLLLASGPTLHLYLYHLDVARDDIRRYHKRNLVKLAAKLEMSSGTDITCASAVNEFFSYVVLVGGCDRSVEVFDLNVGRPSAHIPGPHTRAVHHVAQNKGSSFCAQGFDFYNLFLTSAVTDGMKLWDLRILRCVRKFEGHQNRCHPCTSAFSPCGRYIATGSEDNSAYLYDIRSSSYLKKLPRHTDTVLNVAFSPCTPERFCELPGLSAVCPAADGDSGWEAAALQTG
nr:WD repeat-containing protein 27 isoform X3 [Paramormyrops kingsleyae]